MSVAAGVVFAIVGVNKIAGFFVFSWLAFLATICFYRAFSVTFPEANRRRYAYLVFFLPSLLFWTSAISKEAMMYHLAGLMAYGAALVLTQGRGGVGLLVIGTIIGVYVRPQEIAVVPGSVRHRRGLPASRQQAVTARHPAHPGHGPAGRLADRGGDTGPAAG